MASATHIPVADRAFMHRQYKDAFRAYYQFFFCFNGGDFEWIHGGAEDSGAAQYLRDAIGSAYDGNYKAALQNALRAYQVDSRFTEAMFIAGELQWLLHRRNDAYASWQLAENTDVGGYPEPNDHARGVPLFVRSTRRLLHAAKSGVLK